jgi:SAM-dependent methyltransferase
VGVTADTVVWHDVECGSYAADLPLWRELASDPARPRGPVLDLGAGTGRVALDLAGAGHEVHALDVDPAFLAALRSRGGALPVHTHVADARDFSLGDTRFGLILAPMQTVQLLGGVEGRAGMLRSVRAHLLPGCLFAVALANAIDGFEEGDVVVPVPDMRDVDGTVYASRPTAVRAEPGGFLLLRVREKVGPDGAREVSGDEIRLDRVPPETFEAEARAHGLRVLERRRIAETADHVGSEVVVLRG